MAVIKELIRKDAKGAISFGDYTLPEKKKVSDFEIAGDIYKVKSWNEMTKLEKNGAFVYESIPGSAVNVYRQTQGEVSFFVEGNGDTQIILELEEGKEYEVFVGGKSIGKVTADVGGKIVFNVELSVGNLTNVVVK